MAAILQLISGARHTALDNSNLVPGGKMRDPGNEVGITAYMFDIGDPCYGQLTPVKTKYPLTIITFQSRFQSRAARVLTGANYNIRSADIIQTLSWDTLDARRLRAKSTLMYEILNDNAAPNLRNSFVRRNVDQTDYHLRNSATNLTLPKPKREFLERSFKYSGVMLWNQLPSEAKLAESIHSFNKYIKT